MVASLTRRLAAAAVAAGALVPVLAAAAPAATAAPKAGAACTRVNARSGALVCTRRAGKLVWVRSAATTKAKAATTKAATVTTAKASTAAPVGIEGTWKATRQSQAGYRVKEILGGQDTEGVGRTNAVTGTLVIQGTRAVRTEITVDVRQLRSDESRRDGQVQGRILDTARFPTATLELLQPVDFGKVPADREAITAKADVELTLRGTTKAVTVDLQARRNGATIEVLGSIPITFSSWNIPNPSSGLASVGDHGTIEFLIVFSR